MTKQLPGVPLGLCQCGCGNRTTVSTRNDSRRGWVKGQPKRFLPGHRKTSPADVRFWEKVDKGDPDECWEWQAGLFESGYGAFQLNGKARKAHRVAYELAKGPIPEGHVMCHSCDNPKCCNPAHLWPGTPADNNADMVAKGRGKVLKGVESPNSKVTEADVIEIRLAYPGQTLSELADRFGLTESGVHLIVSRKTWAHVVVPDGIDAARVEAEMAA